MASHERPPVPLFPPVSLAAAGHSLTQAMKRIIFLLASCLLALAPAMGADKPAAGSKVPRGLEVLIAADAIASPEGFRPEPGHPIHYVFGQSRLTIGDPVAGVKLPEPAAVEQAVTAELAKQGFARTKVGGPMPELFILAIVGDANFEEPTSDPAEMEPYIALVNQRRIVQDHPEAQSNPDLLEQLIYNEAIRIRYQQSLRLADKPKIEALLGATKVTRAVKNGTMMPDAADRVAWAAYENRYYVSVNAFDAAKYAKKEKVLLWRTNLFIDWRNDLALALPAMLAQAGPLFGTDVAVPTFVDDRDRKKADVKIGEATVVPDAKTAVPVETKK